MTKFSFQLLGKGVFLLVIVNTIYLSSYNFRKEESSIRQGFFYSNSEYLQVNYESSEPNPSFEHEVQKLFEKVELNEDNKFWLKDTDLTNTELTVDPKLFLQDSDDENAWVNKDTLYYDVRLTLSLYLDYIRKLLLSKQKSTRERPSEVDLNGTNLEPVSVPFHWADWLDLTGLNTDLSVSLERRRTCQWIEDNIDPGNYYKFKHLNCKNIRDLTIEEINSYGFDRIGQMPGQVTSAFSLNRGTIDVRVAQGQSYCMTHMPVPFKLVFLNNHNGTYEVNVDQEKPPQRIVKSGMMESYLESNGLSKDSKGLNKISLDPVKEFKKLKTQTKPSYITLENDIYGVYDITHTFKNNPKLLPIPKDAFHYDVEEVNNQITAYKELEEYIPLNYIQQSYLESLELSKERNTYTEYPYFRLATLWYDHDRKNRDHDRGYHYDWRFFRGTMNSYKGWTREELTLRQEVILDRMARSWFRFMEEKGFVSWIMYGPLLAWNRNGIMFPFDNDLDIQMPAKDLARLGELYNQTLIIEDVEEGFGKYLIDVSSFVHNRDISRRENHIDARIIDVDTGMYIDVTGVAASDAEVPDNYLEDKELVKISKEDPKSEIYNDRRTNFYKYEQLSPLRYSMLGGVPLFVPHDIPRRLIYKYKDAIVQTDYSKWYFIPLINLWVYRDRFVAAFDHNDYRKISENEKEHGQIDYKKLHEMIIDIDEEQVLQLLRNDDTILCEYYKTKKLTDVHVKEKEYMYTVEKTKDKDGMDKLEIHDITPTGTTYDEYAKFVNENFKMTKPLRKSLFQLEYVDQPAHHAEFLKDEKDIKDQNI